MPETRPINVYENGVFIGIDGHFEVSDEQLQDEADRLLCEQYLAQSPPVITMPELWFILRCLAKQLGYDAP